MREKLIELIGYNGSVLTANDYEDLAEYLLANGVIVLPCKVGDTIYQVLGYSVSEYEIAQVRFDDFIMWFYCENQEYAEECKHFLFDETRIGKTVFLTREEAEAALKEGQG